MKLDIEDADAVAKADRLFRERAAARGAALDGVWVQHMISGGVELLVAIGGNDTADCLHRIHEATTGDLLGPRVVGIPKTIDNDLPGMDHCPGYGSAARYLAMGTREAGLDTAAMQQIDPVKVIEVMGRNAGWLAASSALAREHPNDAPQVIFLPERPRSLARMIEEIDAAYRRLGWAVVVVCENQRNEVGEPIAGAQPIHVDAYGHPYYDSVGAYLAWQVRAGLGIRARHERPGSLQRTSAATISETDAVEAELVGAEAVRRALDGETDVMVAIQREERGPYSIRLESLPLADVARQERCVEDRYIAHSGIDVTAAFLDYARPLIGGPLAPVLRL